MRNAHGFMGAVLVLAFALPADAQVAKKYLAVLEFKNDADLSDFEKETLADDVREASLVLPRDQYVILTRESMMRFLPPGTDLANCSEGGCEVDAGIRVNADYVVSGSVGRIDREFVAKVKLFDTHTSELLGSKSAPGADLRTLRQNMRAEVQALFMEAVGRGQGGGATVVAAPGATSSSGPVVKKRQITQVVADLTIAGRPRDRVRLEITDPSGRKTVSGSPFKDPLARIGRWKVVASADGCEAEELAFDVSADEVLLKEIEARPLGGLEIDGTPAGAAVEVTGPGGFRDSGGGLPWSAAGLRRGAYRVTVTRQTYETYDQTHHVTSGSVERVRVDLKKPSERPAPVPSRRRPGKTQSTPPAAGKLASSYGWDPNRPADFLWSLGIVGINGISRGSDHYSLSIVPSEIGVLLGNRWRIAATIDVQLVFNSDAPKNTGKDGDSRLLMQAGGVVGMQLFETASFGMAMELGGGYEYNADRCNTWDMSKPEGKRCVSWTSVPNGYVLGGKLRFGLLKRWMNVVLRVDYSGVNGLLGGAFFAIGG